MMYGLVWLTHAFGSCLHAVGGLGGEYSMRRAWYVSLVVGFVMMARYWPSMAAVVSHNAVSGTRLCISVWNIKGT